MAISSRKDNEQTKTHEKKKKKIETYIVYIHVEIGVHGEFGKDFAFCCFLTCIFLFELKSSCIHRMYIDRVLRTVIFFSGVWVVCPSISLCVIVCTSYLYTIVCFMTGIQKDTTK